jgi:hypothetical protein
VYWALLGMRVLSRGKLLFVDGEHQRVQEGERKEGDMVEHVGFNQSERWHGEVVSCHGMAQ